MTERPNNEDRKTKKVGKESVIEIIGEAIAKNVFCGRFDDKDVVIKRVDHYDIKHFDIRELKFLREFDHENVVKYKFKDSDDNFLYMVLEKCDTTLAQFINDDRKDEVYHLDILWQISKGLAYLHEDKDLVHRDLKPSNVLMLFRDKRWVAKITDFGISKSLPPDRTRVTQSAIKGTEGYMAPEQMMGGKIGKHTDIYSLGLIFHFVLSEGKHPFGTHSFDAERKMLDKSASPDLNNIKDEYKHDAETLVLCMIAHQEEDRVHIKQVQAHHLFWTPEKKLTFYQQVSDHIIQPQIFDKMKPIFEKRLKEVAGDWRQTIRAHSAIVGKVLDSPKMRTKRQGDGICDLVRNIRNVKNHYDEKEIEFKAEIGEMPDGVYQFFKLLFPKLLNYVYDIMKCYAEDSKFVDFYLHREQEHLRQPLGSSTDVVVEESPSQSEGKIYPQQTASLTETADVVNNSDPKYSQNQNEVKENAPEVAPGTGLTRELEIMAVDKMEGKSDLVLRDYQKELAQQALRGENSLIVAPTGSGKTAVLTEVIKQHLKKFQENGRVIFMVPKTALARQQFRYLQRHLEGHKVDYMIGQFVESAPVSQRILNNQVTVLTPQVLINELKKDLSFNDLSMLIFDECHNATKSHPYRQLMDMLFDFEDIKTKPQPIQVIGVTASPGVGKAKDQLKVRNKLIELLGNLNVMFAPTTVEKNLEELGRHHSKIKEYFLQVQTEKEFANEVEMTIEELESAIFKLLKDVSFRNAPPGKASQPYDNWIEDLKETAQLHVLDGEKSRLILSYATNLKLYHYLLQLKDLVPNAMEQAKKKINFSTEGPERAELERKYEELQTKAVKIKTPMFEKLLTILQGEFKQNPNARCMVFVEWKLTAECLTDSFSRSDELDGIKSAYLIGTQTSGGTKGMSKSEQEVIVEAFRDGKYKVLIATSIAEEGLHFGDCSLVIMYNYVTGEVGRQQRHGRGRTETCRAIIMATVGSDHKKREEDNRSRAEATKKAIADIKKSNLADLRQQIKNAQKKHKNERERRGKAAETDSRNGEPPAKWQILCGACKNFLTTGDKLRHIENTHTIVKDKEFFCRTEKRDVKKDKAPTVKGLADYHCKGNACGEKVALGIDRENKLYPALSIKRIIVKNEEGRIRNPKKRKNLPFKIDIGVDDSEGDDDDDMYEKIDNTLNTEEDSTETSLNDQDCLEFLEIMDNEGN